MAAVGVWFAALYAVPEFQLVNTRMLLVAAFVPFGMLACAAALVPFFRPGAGGGRCWR